MYLDRETGTPQGGVISPLLANIFLHSLSRIAGWSSINGWKLTILKSHPIAIGLNAMLTTLWYIAKLKNRRCLF